MTKDKGQVSCWWLEGNTARLQDANWTATLDLSKSWQGLSLTFSGAAASTAPFQILGFTAGRQSSASEVPCEAYCRGDDLVATYDEALPNCVRAQSYWRKIAPAEFAPGHERRVLIAFDLILSLNTSLLDSDPESKACSQLISVQRIMNFQPTQSGASDWQQIELPSRHSTPGNAVVFSAANDHSGCFVADLRHSPFSYVEMVHPIDFYRSVLSLESTMETGDAVQIEHHLFPLRLEKGVILRARIRSAIVQSSHAQAAAAEAYNHFAAAEPPLTV
jgi:hypothetical protein